jgi:hypothetical protein
MWKSSQGLDFYFRLGSLTQLFDPLPSFKLTAVQVMFSGYSSVASAVSPRQGDYLNLGEFMGPFVAKRIHGK